MLAELGRLAEAYYWIEAQKSPIRLSIFRSYSFNGPDEEYTTSLGIARITQMSHVQVWR